jgi:hypothetical protein
MSGHGISMTLTRTKISEVMYCSVIKVILTERRSVQTGFWAHVKIKFRIGLLQERYTEITAIDPFSFKQTV